MFERYTERARRVIFFARYESSVFGSKSIETEHLLLGLLREYPNLSRFFRDKPPVSHITETIKSRIQAKEPIPTTVDLPLSAESRQILSAAAEEADQMNHRHIGTEHLLLGIFRAKG